MLGAVSYAPELATLYSDPSPLGLLLSLLRSPLLAGDETSVSNREAVFAAMPRSDKDTLRTFLLDSILAKLTSDDLTKVGLHRVMRLPVWLRCGGGSDGIDGRLHTLYARTSGLLKIPPLDAEPALLTDQFVALRSDSDRQVAFPMLCSIVSFDDIVSASCCRAIYLSLGLEQVSTAAFLLEHLLPQVTDFYFSAAYVYTSCHPTLVPAQIEAGGLGVHVDRIAVQILRTLPLMESECPGFTDSVSSIPFIRTRGTYTSVVTLVICSHSNDGIRFILFHSLSHYVIFNAISRRTGHAEVPF